MAFTETPALHRRCRRLRCITHGGRTGTCNGGVPALASRCHAARRAHEVARPTIAAPALGPTVWSAVWPAVRPVRRRAQDGAAVRRQGRCRLGEAVALALLERGARDDALGDRRLEGL